VEIHFAQAYSLRLPMVVLFLGTLLLGVLIAGLSQGTLSVKNFFVNLKVVGRNKLQNKVNHRIEVLLEEAENFLVGGCDAKAILVYEKILELSPNHVAVLIRLGNRLREEGDPDRALKLHLKAVQNAPNNLGALYSLADDYSVKGRQSFTMYQMEMNTLEKIGKIDRKSPRVYYRMREIHLKSEDWILAIDVQKQIISRIEDKDKKIEEKKILGQYIYNNGIQYFSKDNFEAAIPEFKKALRENIRCLPAHILLGNTFAKTSNGKAALKAWKTGYEKTNSPVCLIYMEKFFRESSQAEEMIKVYNEEIKKAQNSTRETLGLLLGSLYLEEGNPGQTIRVIEENTDSEKAIIPSLILANAHKQQQDEEHSKKNLENISSHLKSAILNFKCNRCGEVLGEWVDSCPSCGAFDEIECRPGVNTR